MQGMMSGIESLKQNNFNLITQMQKSLDEEEESDNALRTQYGNKWNRMPSSALNQTFRQQLIEYGNKLQQASNTDEQINNKFSQNQEAL